MRPLNQNSGLGASRSALVLGCFFLFGVFLASRADRSLILWLLSHDIGKLPGRSTFLFFQWRLYALFFLLGSSLIGFYVIPIAFLFRGLSMAVFFSASCRAFDIFSLPFLRLGFSFVLSTCSLLFVGFHAYDSSRSIYDAVSVPGESWFPIPLQAFVSSVLLSLLSTAVYRPVSI